MLSPVSLMGYRVDSFEIKNNAVSNTKLTLKNKVKYNVNYVKSRELCIGKLELTVSDQETDRFEIKLQITAQFGYDPTTEKEEIHKKSFDLIFPVIRVMVSTITASMGMPGLVLPPMKLDKGIMISTQPPEDADDADDDTKYFDMPTPPDER